MSLRRVPHHQRVAHAPTGCDDALVGIGLPGRVALGFTREAERFEVARTAMRVNLAKDLRQLPAWERRGLAAPGASTA